MATNQLDFRVKNGLIVGGNANIGGAITSVNSIQLDTTATYAAPIKAQLVWNETEGSYDVGLENSVVANIPEVTLYRVTNNTASTIPKGTLVASHGTSGNSGKLFVAPWNPAVHSAVQIMGISSGQILAGGDGHVTHFGKIRGIQTNGANYSEVWAQGDILYAKPGGGLTKTLPTAPNTKTIVAIVISAHPSNGTIFVRPTLSSSIANDDLVQLTSIANGDLLVYNSTTARFENSKSLGGTLTLSDGNANGVLYLNASKQVTSGTALTFDGTKLGINVQAPYGGPYATVHAYEAAGAVIRLDRTGAGTTTIQSVETAVAYRDLTLDASSLLFNLSGVSKAVLNSNGLEIKDKLAVGYSSFTNIPANGAAFLGGVGIGTNAPAQKLHVAGNILSTAGNYFADTTSGYFWAGSGSYAGGIFGSNSGNVATLVSPQTIVLRTATLDRVTVDVNGNVGINQTNPIARLQVEEMGLDTTTTTLQPTFLSAVIYSAPVTAFRTLELMVQVTKGSSYHSVKIFALHNGTDVWYNQTNVLHTADELGRFFMEIVSGNVQLTFIPSNAGEASTIKVGAIKMAV